ncbi:hypothetical protein ACNRBH_20315, partial [Ralstonia pseudosolanacearum]|uniref:hypothetical protein n=1 Tax=Ralstonia pseudosolanacearum TaxID=1310165 RepID=UPI000CE3D784|nr:hypothetical protein [Ralstonia pseudosolanacearum]MDO3530219.1 hypothetical protein [Ralstonia pseudosolanacearum]MDO3534663.1 hypothetical protein [Ralstonia pseudosolanacearum]
MANLKMVCAIASALLGVATAVAAGFHGHYWSAVGLLIAGMICAASCLVGFDEVRYSVLGAIGGLLFFAAGWSALMTESPGFDLEGQSVKVAVGTEALQADGLGLIAPELSQLAKRVSMACWIEGGAKDQLNAAIDGAKTIYFGPTATLADATMAAVAHKSDAPDCLTLFRQLYAAAPGAFTSINAKHGPWLRAHGINP